MTAGDHQENAEMSPALNALANFRDYSRALKGRASTLAGEIFLFPPVVWFDSPAIPGSPPVECSSRRRRRRCCHSRCRRSRSVDSARCVRDAKLLPKGAAQYAAMCTHCHLLKHRPDEEWNQWHLIITAHARKKNQAPVPLKMVGLLRPLLSEAGPF